MDLIAGYEHMIDVRQVGVNVFVEFKIIQDSNPIRLALEIDNLIAYGKKVYSWSKLVTPHQQALYCTTKIIPRPPEEKEKHRRIKEMRDSGASYEEISNELAVNAKEIGFFLKRPLNKEWSLADYFLDFYKKDSSIYPKVDVIIDPDPNLIERFKKIGIHGNIVERV